MIGDAETAGEALMFGSVFVGDVAQIHGWKPADGADVRTTL
jgi:hypothetical protein